LEAALYWRKQFEELATMKHWDAESKFTNALLLLTGDAKDKWMDAQEDILADNEPTDALFANTMNIFIRRCGATADAAEDLREFLMNAKKPASMSLQNFKRRLTELNCYLPYLPGPLNQKLDDYTLFSTLKKCVPAWHQTFIQTNARVMIDTIDELMDYYEALENQEEKNRDRRNQGSRQNSNRRNDNYQGNNRSSNSNQNRNSNNQNRQNNQTANQNQQNTRGLMWCDFHKTDRHDNSNCRVQQRQQDNTNSSNRRENSENQPRH
jgi:hypothetical protein